jgi:hypothetical protein
MPEEHRAREGELGALAETSPVELTVVAGGDRRLDGGAPECHVETHGRVPSVPAIRLILRVFIAHLSV